MPNLTLRQGVTLVLGVNFWGACAALPLWYAGLAETRTAVGAGLAAVALVALLWGGARARAWALLGAFPMLVALAAMMGGRPTSQGFGPVTFVTTALCFLAYCLSAANFSRPRADGAAASKMAPAVTPAVTIEPLSERPAPERWRLRLSALRILTVAAAVFPAALVVPPLLREGTPDLLALAAIPPLWTGVFIAYLRTPAWAFYVGTEEREPSRPTSGVLGFAMRSTALAAAVALVVLLFVIGGSWGGSR